MSSQYLNKSGLTYLWSKLKVLLAAKQNTLPTGSAGQVLTYGANGWAPANLPAVLPAAPSSAGSYLLQCVVANGTATYSWVELENYNTEAF